MTPWFICLALFLLLVITGFITYRLMKTNAALKRTIKAQKQNLVYIMHHAEELAEIQKHKAKTDIAIEEAKTDEEILEIINTIVNGNNERVS